MRGRVFTKAWARSKDGAAPINDQQADSMSHDRITFIGFVANAMIVGYRNPTPLANLLKPY
jgi:hypothetical protein